MDAFGIDGEVSGRAHARAIMHAQRRVRGGFDGVQSPGDFFFRKTEARIAVPSRDTRLPLRFQSRVVNTEKVSEPTEFFGQIQRSPPKVTVELPPVQKRIDDFVLRVFQSGRIDVHARLRKLLAARFDDFAQPSIVGIPINRDALRRGDGREPEEKAEGDSRPYPASCGEGCSGSSQNVLEGVHGGEGDGGESQSVEACVHGAV